MSDEVNTTTEVTPTPVKEFTLADLLPLQTAELQLVHPTHGVLPAKLTVTGAHVSSLRAQGAEAQAWALKATRETSTSALATIVGHLENNAEDTAAKAIVGWNDAATKFFGEPYSPATALKIMRMEGTYWIRSQVNHFVQDQSNFFRQAPIWISRLANSRH